MKDIEHRTHSFRGVGVNNATTEELREFSRTSNSLRTPRLARPGFGSPVEDVVCFRDTVRQLGDYFSTLSDAEVLAVQAQNVLPQIPQSGGVVTRTIDRLGVTGQRLAEIRQEMKAIIFG